MRGVLVRLVVFYLVWLALDDNVSQPELFTGVGVAIFATVIATLASRVRTSRAQIQVSMLRYAYRPLILLVLDSSRVTVALFRTLVLRRPVHGRFRAVRYRERGGGETATARRVLTEWGGSLAANRYVIGIDTDEDILLVHELMESRAALDPLELG